MRKSLIGLIGIAIVNLFTLSSEVSSVEGQQVSREFPIEDNTIELEDKINKLNEKLDSLVYETDSIIVNSSNSN